LLASLVAETNAGPKRLLCCRNQDVLLLPVNELARQAYTPGT